MFRILFLRKQLRIVKDQSKILKNRSQGCQLLFEINTEQQQIFKEQF